MTRELFFEVSKTLISKKYKIFCYGFAILSFLFGIESIIIADWESIYAYFFFGCTIYLIAMVKISQRNIGKLYEQQRAINNYEPLTKVINFYEDKAEVISVNGGKTIIFYKNIKNITKTDNFFVINSENKVSIGIKKDGFTKGTCKDFEEFIFSKFNK